MTIDVCHGDIARDHAKTSGNRKPRGRGRRVALTPPWWRELAAKLAVGVPITVAATELGRTRQAANRATRDPRFAGLLDAAAARARADAEQRLALARPQAVAALSAVLTTAERDPAAVAPRDVLAAAQSLLNASAPPSRAIVERAEALFMKRLARIDADLARRVGEAMAGDDAATLASMSVEELDAAIGFTGGRS